MSDDSDLRKWVATAVGGLITLTLAVNGFFVSKLVDKIELFETKVWELRQEVTVMHYVLDEFTKKRK